MNTHIQRRLITLLAMVSGSGYATVIVIRGDGEQIAVAVDSKTGYENGTSETRCKVYPITGGVFLVAGRIGLDFSSTETGPRTIVYDTERLGPEAANGLDEPWAMVSRFTRLIEPRFHIMLQLFEQNPNHREELHKLASGFSILQVAYVANVRGVPAFYARTFYFTVVRGAPTVAYKDRSCPGTCRITDPTDSYAMLGPFQLDAFVGANPEMFLKSPREFVEFFAKRAVNEMSSVVAEPLTILSVDGTGRKWNSATLGACSEVAKKYPDEHQGIKGPKKAPPK